MNMSNAYVVHAYPRQIATAKSVAQQGKNLGSIVSAPLLVYIVERDRAAAFVLGGLGIVAAGCGLAANLVVMGRAVDALKRRDKALELERSKPWAAPVFDAARLTTGAADYDAYVDSLRDDLKRIFTERHYEAPLRWNGGAQRWIRRVLDKALPPIAAWTDDDGGAAFVADLTALLATHGESRAVERIKARHAAFAAKGHTSLDDWVFQSASAYACGTVLSDPAASPPGGT